MKRNNRRGDRNRGGRQGTTVQNGKSTVPSHLRPMYEQRKKEIGEGPANIELAIAKAMDDAYAEKTRRTAIAERWLNSIFWVFLLSAVIYFIGLYKGWW